MVHRRLVLSFALWTAIAFVAPNASAQSAADRATARELGVDGQDALNRKDYATAEDRFRRADALFHAPTLLLGFARAEAALGKLVNASEAYNRIIREGVASGAPEAFVSALEAAKSEIGGVQSRISNVIVNVLGPDNPSVTLDEQAIPTAALGVKRPVDPGTHVLRATAPGWDPAETRFTVVDAASATATLTMKRSGAATTSAATTDSSLVTAAPANAAPAPEAPSTGAPGSKQALFGWIGVGVGGAALITGVITGSLAIGQHSTLANECPGGVCQTSAAQNDLSSYHTMGTVSTIGFIAGVVLGGGGLVLVLTAPRSASAAATVRPYVGLGSLGAVGSF
jgi:hypothetical protein